MSGRSHFIKPIKNAKKPPEGFNTAKELLDYNKSSIWIIHAYGDLELKEADQVHLKNKQFVEPKDEWLGPLTMRNGRENDRPLSKLADAILFFRNLTNEEITPFNDAAYSKERNKRLKRIQD